MKPFIPTDEEWETILVALSSYEKEMVTSFVIGQYLKKVEDIDDEQAFMKAFSKKLDEVDQSEIDTKTKSIRDRVTVIAAKVIQLRDHVREQRLVGAIDELTT